MAIWGSLWQFCYEVWCMIIFDSCWSSFTSVPCIHLTPYCLMTWYGFISNCCWTLEGSNLSMVMSNVLCMQTHDTHHVWYYQLRIYVTLLLSNWSGWQIKSCHWLMLNTHIPLLSTHNINIQHSQIQSHIFANLTAQCNTALWPSPNILFLLWCLHTGYWAHQE